MSATVDSAIIDPSDDSESVPPTHSVESFPRFVAQACLHLLVAWLAWECALLTSPDRDHHLSFGILGALGIWRYGWLITNVVRSWLYRYISFPALRRRADAVPSAAAFPAQLHVIIPTYREHPWVTEKMLHSVLTELSTFPGRKSIYLTTGSAHEDAVARRIVESGAHDESLRLTLLRQNGKRSGMAFALRAAARANGDTQSCVVMMDGDTVLAPGVIRRSLPFFAFLDRLGALTTNNTAVTRGPSWYRSWYSLRFALRNRYMCSASLSRRVLTLTGRFSIFRGDLVLTESFIARLERDGTDDWLHGRIEFKTGDDKSTWYELLREGWEMLYVPDTTILCLENAGAAPFAESLEKMRRWFGNMLRNNGRALAVGPARTGWFVWFMLLDQRISMWTSLVLPVTVILLCFVFSPVAILFAFAWVVATRFLYVCSLVVEGHHLSALDVPLLVFQQWGGSFMKIVAFSDLRRQRWAATREDRHSGDSPWFSYLQTGLWLSLFVLVTAVVVLT